MIYAGDFRKGMTFEIDGDPHVVLDFQHVKPGKGAAFVRTKHKKHPDWRYQGRINSQPGCQVPESTHRNKDDAVFI